MYPVLKYVRLRRHDDSSFEIRFALPPQTHRQVAAEMLRTHSAHSAGWVELRPGPEARCFGDSNSLCLTPAADDSGYISAMLRGTALAAPARPHDVSRQEVAGMLPQLVEASKRDVA